MGLAAAHGITLSHGGFTVTLRPSLRAAATLERLHDGFANLFRRLGDFDTATIKAVIEAAATDRQAAAALIASAADKPLRPFVEAVIGPINGLCEGLVPAPKTQGKTTGKPMPWSEAFGELFRLATGWLQWPPETAWNATPDEITEAFEGHIAMLKAVHGSAEEASPNTEEQRQRNIAAGLDPDFDRDGLRALKAKHC